MMPKLFLIGCLLTALTLAAAVVNAQQPTQNTVDKAYQAILDAYHAGADPSSLIDQLNQALNLTNQAQQETDSQKAATLTSQAQTQIQNVTQTAQDLKQAASVPIPVVPLIVVCCLLIVGVVAYFWGPRLILQVWFKLHKKYRVTFQPVEKSKSFVVTLRQICALILAGTVLVAAVTFSEFYFPPSQTEPFTALGLLGPNQKLGDYPSQIVVNQPVKLYIYVDNQMGKPMLYTIPVKVGNNYTQTNPAPVEPIWMFEQVLANNQSWIFPVTINLTQPGDNQRVIFELWFYNETTNQNQYQPQRWAQLWLNVTAVT
ncbi:MAG: DUF1616 domain-containing protein [Candidatus Bathyarchaeota archaeon]|nr:DUF1616 domain-containing protein [Candidatus Bathyarchaeota archaeon]